MVVRGIVITGEDKTVEDRTGEYLPNQTSMQVEAYPKLYKGDLIFRVNHWKDYSTPAVIGDRFRVTTVKPNDLRVGTYQPMNEAKIGQNLTIAKIPESHAIYEIDLTNLSLPLPGWPEP